jgi:hypothetical protein
MSFAGGSQAGGDTDATSNVEIISLKVPITWINLGNTEAASEAATLYQCPGDKSDCLIELATPDFEKNILPSSSVTVREGTYNQIVVGYCAEGESSHTVQLTARAVLNGATHYTKADGSMSPVAPAEPALITLSGCASASTMPYAVEVTPDGVEQEMIDMPEDGPLQGETALRLYFTTENLAWAAVNTAYAIHFPGFCAVSSEDAASGTPYICLGYPDVAGFLATEVPAIERYTLDVESAITFFKMNDHVMGGFIRRVIDGPADPYRVFTVSGSIMEVKENEDGSIRFNGIKRADTGIYEYLFPGFSRSSHSGTFFDHYGTEFPYAATRAQ